MTTVRNSMLPTRALVFVAAASILVGCSDYGQVSPQDAASNAAGAFVGIGFDDVAGMCKQTGAFFSVGIRKYDPLTDMWIDRELHDRDVLFIGRDALCGNTDHRSIATYKIDPGSYIVSGDSPFRHVCGYSFTIRSDEKLYLGTYSLQLHSIITERRPDVECAQDSACAAVLAWPQAPLKKEPMCPMLPKGIMF